MLAADWVRLGWPFLAAVFEDGVGEMREVGALSSKDGPETRTGMRAPGG